MSSTKDALKENLHRYREQAEALLLVPFGTQPAEVSGEGGYAASFRPRVFVVGGGDAVVIAVAVLILVVAGVAIEVRWHVGRLTAAKIDSCNCGHTAVHLLNSDEKDCGVAPRRAVRFSTIRTAFFPIDETTSLAPQGTGIRRREPSVAPGQ